MATSIRHASLVLAERKRRILPAWREPARVRYLRRRPESALTVDRYEEDWAKLAWVQVLGKVRTLDADEDGLEALRAKYAQYRERAPAGPFLRLEPQRALCWRAAG
jgi:hypothetical protein